MDCGQKQFLMKYSVEKLILNLTAKNTVIAICFMKWKSLHSMIYSLKVE